MKSLFPIATAFRETLRTYTIVQFKNDLFAAFVVSTIALPLSMALAIAVGLPPEHGIYTAIIAGLIAPLLGGSQTQVSGPTAAFVVILAPIVSEFGLRGIIWASIFAGIILIILGVLRLGRLIKYIPYTVTTGFTTGIAVVLAILSLNDFLGLNLTNLQGSFLNKLIIIITALPKLNIASLYIGLTTIVVTIIASKITRLIPSGLIGLSAGIVVSFLLKQHNFIIETIGTHFYYLDHGLTIQGIPNYPPKINVPNLNNNDLFSFPNFTEIHHLVLPSLTIAILAALESLLSATVADSLAGTKHNPNSELIGIGFANVFSGFASGFAATGAIARTSLNIHNGGRTPISSILHAVFILIYIMFFAQYLKEIPLACLAALLIYTAYHMSHIKQFVTTLKVAHKSDIFVLVTCFMLTVLIDMVAGVFVGILCATFLIIHRLTLLSNSQIGIDNNTSEKNFPLPDGIFLYKIKGPLFFASVERTLDKYKFAHDYIEKFIIDLSDVPLIDMTGLVALKEFILNLSKEGKTVRLVCPNTDISRQISLKLSYNSALNSVCCYKDIKSALAQ